MFTQPRALLLLILFTGLSVSGADFTMKVTDSGYLDTQGFSVILYHNTFHRVFVDQKVTAMEMILHGHRIATNGDVRLLPTPEQWDLVAELKSRDADKVNNRLTALLSFPAYQVDYRLEVAAEPGGVRVSVNLDKPLPEKLVGRAGFNLEFLPSAYVGKAYAVDGSAFGVFPRSPQDPMVKVPPSADDPKKLPYQEEWDEAKGYTQPLPFATGRSITLAVDDPLSRVTVNSETAPLSLYDGRNRAQNGWFVLRTLISAGKTEGAVVWHIRPDVIPNWTRPPMVAHSQVGYPPDFPKVAVIELDPKFNAPKTAKVLRLTDDGAYEQAFEGPVSEPTRGCGIRMRSSISRRLRRPACMRSNTPDIGPTCFRSPKTSIAGLGNRVSTAISPCRWTTFRCARATACGTVFRIWTTPARRPPTGATSTGGGWARISIPRSRQVSIFPA